jgi:hypothetical protein
MKDVDRKDLPAVSGGVKSGDYGDCVTPPTIVLPDYPQFPIPLDPVNPDPLDV